MEMKTLFPAAVMFLVLAVVLGVGVTVLSNMSANLRTATTASNEQHNVYTHNWTTLNNQYVSTTSGYTSVNQSAVAVPLTFDQTGTFLEGYTRVKISDQTDKTHNGTTLNLTYVYGSSTSASTSVTNANTAVGGFTTWMSILVVILAAAVIIGLVVNSFKP